MKRNHVREARRAFNAMHRLGYRTLQGVMERPTGVFEHITFEDFCEAAYTSKLQGRVAVTFEPVAKVVAGEPDAG